MLELDAARRAVKRDVAEVINRLNLASDKEWLKQTPCLDWTVADLAAHLAGGQAFLAEALRRMQAGNEELVQRQPVNGDKATVLAALRDSHRQFAEELDKLTEADLERPVPMPFGLHPLAPVLQIMVVETGVHAQDIQMAMTGQGILPPDVIDATTTALTALFDPGATPAGPVSYHLKSPNIDRWFTWRDGGWVDEPAGEETCCIEADDNALLLFALGRIPADDPGLYTTDIETARRFKDYFPGP